jgi:transaldolase/glucose-6-phosphate isomerase
MSSIRTHPALHLSTHLGAYQSRVEQVLQDMMNDRIVARLWDYDHTLWKPEATDISNRLGWLHSARAMRDEQACLSRFVESVRAAGYTHALLLGMGGSSLAPAVFGHTYGTDHSPLQLAVLDSTDPGAVLAYTHLFEPAHTLFLVSSKSGTTVETLSLFKHFYNHVAATLPEQEAGQHFVAITDPDSPLAHLAERYHFRDVFLADATIGGRYAALSHFGLVPAALVGVDLSRLLDHAEHMMQSCTASSAPDINPGAHLGGILAELTQGGRDKVTLVLSPSLSAFGDWVEQLLAESTGKAGQGMVPILREPLGLPDLYGNDRLFVHIALSGDDEEQHDEILDAIAKAGHPVVHMHLDDPYALGGQFFLWEMATAVAGYRLGINPFDQPDVEAAKQLAHNIIDVYSKTGALPDETPTATYDGLRLYGPTAAKSPAEAFHTFLTQAQPGDYVTMQAYVSPPIEGPHVEHITPELTDFIRETTEIQSTLLSMCARIRDRYHLAATFGYGPRYLHATGQLHKGDAGRGLFIQFTADASEDVPIPAVAGELSPSLSFATLTSAQAFGDRQALAQAGRRLIRFHLGANVIEALHRLNQTLV